MGDACLKVGIDVGTKKHQVGVLSPDGELEEFEITHNRQGFAEFFSRIESHRNENDLPVKVAAEGCNGHIRPLDQKVINKGYELFNVNNLKLARFKEIFPGAAKTDEIDTRKILELFSLQERLPMAKEVITRVHEVPEVNRKLKRLSRRRKQLTDDKKRVQHRMITDLNAVCPGPLSITGSADNIWFLNLLTFRDDLTKLSRISGRSIQQISGVGKKFARKIMEWQKEAEFSSDVEYTGEMIIEDARRILELRRQIEKLDKVIEPLVDQSDLARTVNSIPGFGITGSAELAGEIGNMERFESEDSLALYLGMCPLDNSSGEKTGTKSPRHVNKRAKSAMMTST
ncbi:MAG: transposase, partial [Dehalococcoidales bacterium]|nr:transposase [Dehalococcoidales bacterium]